MTLGNHNSPPNPVRGVPVPAWLTAALTTMILASGGMAQDSSRLEKVEQENKELRERLDTLEQLAKREGLLAGETSKPTSMLSKLAETSISGFVTASYFYDFSTPPEGISPGYLWNHETGAFRINKVNITIENPAEISGEEWSAGYNAILIFGQDAPYVNTGIIRSSDGNIQYESAGLEVLRQAYVELNAPVGNGLDFKIGQLISLLNFESGNGGAVNPNFSQGNQWYFTGNGPSAGAQVAYSFTPVVDVKFRVQNGMFTGPFDNNGSKTMMTSIGLKPDAKTSISLIGFGGREGSANNLWLKGGSLIASRALNAAGTLNVATEFDYFNQDTPTDTVDWWSVGGWVWYNFTPKVGVALRADYLSDPDGAGTSGLLDFPVNNGQDLTSVTVTVTYSPVPAIRIQPEVRYDYTTLTDGFGTQDHRFIVGLGASYLF